MVVEGATNRGTNNFSWSEGNYQEFVVDAGGQTAEVATGGVRINMVPREGSNRYSGTFQANFTNTNLASNNVTDELRRQGLADPNNVKILWRVTPSFGGPLQRDRLWFYFVFTHQVNESYIANDYYNKTHGTMFYTPDPSRQAVDTYWNNDVTGRLTWQATARNKITAYYDYNENCHCVWGNPGATTSPDAMQFMNPVTQMIQGTWSSPVTNRLLFQVGVHFMPQLVELGPQRESVNLVSITDIGIPKTYGSAAGGVATWDQKGLVIRGAMSYVTGTHSLKVGGQHQFHDWRSPRRRPVDYSYTRHPTPWRRRSTDLWAF